MPSATITTAVTTRQNLSGTDILEVTSTGTLIVSANAQSARLNGPSTNVQIINDGTIENTATAGRAIRAEATVGSTLVWTINNTGLIRAQDDAVQIQAGSIIAGSLGLTSSGTITSTVGGQGLDLAGGVGGFLATIGNSGTISAAAEDAIRLFGGTVNNTGSITGGSAAGYSAGADGVQVEANGTVTINNTGSGAISADRHGINGGANSTVTVVNGAPGVGGNLATITGNNGSGVGLDGSGSVTNYGTISGNFANATGSDINGSTPGSPNGGGPDGTNDGDGDGIDIDGLATIINFGLIRGTGAGGTGSDGRPNTAEGIAAGGGNITNHAGATIIGLGLGILVDDSATGNAPFGTNITNSGTITGTNVTAIRLIGVQQDTIDNAGTISTGGTHAIQFGDGNDRLVLRAASSITGISDGEAGDDYLDYRSWTGSGVSVNLVAGTASGTGGVAGFESVTASAQADSINGNAAANTIYGFNGDDVIQGGDGNDTLDGEDGFDIASFADASRAVFVGLLLGGSSVLVATPQNTQGAGTDRLANFEGLLGSGFNDTLGGDTVANSLSGGNGNDLLFGDGGNDSLQGDAGHDTLHGGAGNDSMTGGAGDDVYVVDALGDQVIECAAAGADAVFVGVSNWALASHAEVFYLFGAGVALQGGSLADVMVANTAGGTLLGGEGDDALWGRDNADDLQGEAGRDVLRGGGGNDVLRGGAGNDQLVGGAGADQFRFGAEAWGYDQIFDFAAGDRLDFRGSGVGAFGNLQRVEIGGNTAVLFGAERIDLYGFTGLAAGDCLF